MTLTTEQSSNKAKYEAAPTAEIIDIIRTAMGEGCIRPCNVYDAVDELICRMQALENRPKRNCDVGTVEDQSQRFEAFCDANKYVGDDGTNWCLTTCPCHHGIIDCGVAWAQMPYEEGGAK